MLFLVHTDTKAVVPLTPENCSGWCGEFTVGRLNCSLNLVEDRSVSRSHAILNIIDGKKVILKDANSRYGTFVNSKQLQTGFPTELKLDDIVRFGVPSTSTANSSNVSIVKCEYCLTDDLKPFSEKRFFVYGFEVDEEWMFASLCVQEALPATHLILRLEKLEEADMTDILKLCAGTGKQVLSGLPTSLDNLAGKLMQKLPFRFEQMPVLNASDEEAEELSVGTISSSKRFISISNLFKACFGLEPLDPKPPEAAASITLMCEREAEDKKGFIYPKPSAGFLSKPIINQLPNSIQDRKDAGNTSSMVRIGLKKGFKKRARGFPICIVSTPDMSKAERSPTNKENMQKKILPAGLVQLTKYNNNDGMGGKDEWLVGESIKTVEVKKRATRPEQASSRKLSNATNSPGRKDGFTEPKQPPGSRFKSSFFKNLIKEKQ